MRKLLLALVLSVMLSVLVALPGEAQEAYGYYGYSEVDAATDYYGLPQVFHAITWRESRDDPFAVNPYSGACSAFQFLPSTAYSMKYVPTSSRYGSAYGYTCAELTDPYVAAKAAKELYLYMGLSPWALTAY